MIARQKLRLFFWIALLAIPHLFWTAGKLDAATLYSVIVADTDSNLEFSLKYDLRNIRTEMQEISKHTGLTPKEMLFTGKSARAARILTQLKNLKTNSKDLIIFYFSGHGYRTALSGKSPWPNLYFDFEENGINVNTILQILNRQSAHLKIVITDCCNEFFPEDQVLLVKTFPYNEKALNLIKQNYRKLFLETRGTIIATSCQPGEVSLALQNGSIYTLSFLDSLHMHVRKPSRLLNWKAILESTHNAAAKKAMEFEYSQNSVFQVF